MAGEKDVHTTSSTREIAKALTGISFPADKQKVVEYAQKMNLSDQWMGKLKNLPDAQYTSMADVFKGIGEE